MYIFVTYKRRRGQARKFTSYVEIVTIGFPFEAAAQQLVTSLDVCFIL